MHKIHRFYKIAAALLLLLSFSLADEGMWTFDNPPKKQLKEKYGFDITQEWLDHVRLSSVRFNDGGSGSFISPNGLVMTNHHVGLGQLQKMSTEKMDYVKLGFYAATQEEEVKCVDLELNVLMEMENVSNKVLGAVKQGMNDKEAADAKKAVIAQLTKESTEKSGLRSDIVSFYNGNEYWIYKYKKFTDVRLVMAPEQQIAFFGGDPDNFTYPRYDVDMCFFRVYENGKPFHSDNYLKWNTAGAQDQELVFVSGHPGSTNRQQTYSQLEFARDYSYPYRLEYIKRMIATLKEYSKLGEEQSRRALVQIFGLENAQKVWKGEYKGLQDAKLMEKKLNEEKTLREKINANPEWKKQYGWAWDSISAAIERSKKYFTRDTYRGLSGRLFSLATIIARYPEQMKKPNGERLPQYQDANIEATKFGLFSRAPIYTDLEKIQLSDRLKQMAEGLGTNDPYVKIVLNGKTPEEAATALIDGTQLGNIDFRKKLFEGGEKEITASTDPMLVLARKIIPFNDETMEWNEKYVTSVIGQAAEAVGKARFALYGKELPPDATFTLRLSYGQVKGYPMNGTIAPSITTMFGLYDRAYSFQNKGDFELPQRYVDGLSKLNLKTPMNFVSTNDIIGGNSGSPVINAKAEVVGLIFDGNIESLPGRFLYSEDLNRAVAVHSGVMIETMRKLYGASKLADEIEGVQPAPEPPKAAPQKSVKPTTKKKK
ncbi:MAG: S46 family peptidase [Bacteroidetes bacterium]|nr:S46 family peptidase [Bacteroidota bacterium]